MTLEENAKLVKRLMDTGCLLSFTSIVVIFWAAWGSGVVPWVEMVYPFVITFVYGGTAMCLSLYGGKDEAA